MSTTKIIIAKQNNNDDCYKINDLLEDSKKVIAGDVLFTLETSKALIEVPAKDEGYFKLNPEIINGSDVQVGQIVGIIAWSKKEKVDFTINDNKSEKKESINFTKAAMEFAVKNNIDVKKFKDEMIVTLEMLKNLESHSLTLPDKITKPKIAIIGAAGQGLEVLEIIKSQGSFHFSGFIDSRFPKEKEYCGYPIIGNDKSYESIFNKGTKNIVIAGGWLKKPEIITELFLKAKKAGFSFPNIIHNSAIIANDIHTGSGIQIFAKVFIGPNVKIGDGCVINNGAIISHDSKIGKYNFIAPGAILAGNVKVGNFAVLGINSSVYLRKEIPDYFILENNKTF